MTNDLTREQHELLMRPLNASRVKGRKVGGKSLSYLEAWDVRAHLTRLFGFGGWSAEIQTCSLLFCDQTGGKGNWNVSYQVTMRLSVDQLRSYWDDGAVGSAHLPDRGEALDMALKTAVSDAIKRCAINLGTQFGLSLYNNGQLADVIKATLIVPQRSVSEQPGELAPVEKEIEEGVPLADDEVEVDEQTGEIIADAVEADEIDANHQQLLEALRSYAKEPDSAKRVLGVAGLKTEYAASLKEVTGLPSGEVVTLERLANMVAQGVFVNGNGSE